MPIVLVQSISEDAKAVNSTTVAMPSAVIAGHLLVIPIVTFQGTAGTTISTPTDTLAHTYLPVTAQQNDAGNFVHLRSWYVPNSLAGADTITADISGAGTGEITTIPSEWSGVDTVSPLSGTPVLAGPTATATPSTGNITPLDAGCLLIGVLNAGGSAVTITPGAGWTQVQEYEGGNASVTLSVIYKIQTVATPEAATWTLSASRTCLSHIMAFKPLVVAPSAALYGTLGMVGYGR